MNAMRAIIALVIVGFVLEVQAQEPASRITLIELTPHLAVNDAAALVEAQNYAGAIEILDTFVENQTEPVPEAFYLLGVSHYQLGDFDKALTWSELAVTVAPDAPASWIEVVVASMKQRDDYVSALPYLERLVELLPSTKTYWLELSVAYERTGNYDRALATMRLAQSARLLDADADFRRLSDLLVHQGLPVQGAEVLERALADRIVRADEPAYTKLGTAYFTAGELDKAVFPLENASRISSTGDAYVRLAVVHVAREDWPAAVAALHAGMGRGSLSDPGQANILMGVALFRQRQFDEAKTWFEQAVDSPAHRPMAEQYLRAIEQATDG
jgi:tetratricopeptide (TPR) repeat protein